MSHRIALITLAAAIMVAGALPTDAANARDDQYIAQGRGRGNGGGGGGGPNFDNDRGRGNDQGRGNSQGRGNDQGNERGHQVTVERHFLDSDRSIVSQYFSAPPGGRCPPGLAKKNNGCLPPGQAKKLWTLGQPLPMTVAYAALPAVLLGQLGAAPVGYEYIRVANDILLMAVGTRLIAGAVAEVPRPRRDGGARRRGVEVHLVRRQRDGGVGR